MRAFCLVVVLSLLAAPGPLPNQSGSLKLVIVGDTGTGDRPQYEVAAAMAARRAAWRFTDVLMLGDNLYGSERPSDYVRKFEQPYRALLDGGVTFRAALGDEDEREQRHYKLLNMEGRTYYSWKPAGHDARVFFLESSYPDEAQRTWMQTELAAAPEKWKIALFHHPPYSSAGSNTVIRRAWEPLFVAHNVSVVFSAHAQVYERITPQHGILYFVVGSSGKLARGGVNESSPLTAAAFDKDHAFLAVEIAGDVMHFEAISRTGKVVDSGTFTRRR